jgi:chemotaxis protein methyltransferase CheR
MARSPVEPGEPIAASNDEIQLFRDLLARRSGIDFGRHRESYLRSRLDRRMRHVGARNLYEYYRFVVKGGGDSAELQALVDEVSIHETSFFRNAAQFRTLETLAVPERVTARLAERRRRFHVWSAGCSSGQEPYSIAMSVYETTMLPDIWDVRIFATDVSADVVQKARKGIFTPEQMTGVSAERQRRFFDRRDGGFVVRAWLRKHVEFIHANLFAGPPTFDLDVIFCRNVMIYFDQQRQRELMATFARALAPGGFLFLGHAESVAGLSERFRMAPLPSGIAYVRLP